MKNIDCNLLAPGTGTMENQKRGKDMLDLSDLNDAYLSARHETVRDGVYVARLMKAEVQQSRAGNRQVVWDLEVEIPTTGLTTLIKKFNPLIEKSMYWLQKDLTSLGIVLSDLNELPEALEGLAGTIVEVVYKTKEGQYTVSFSRVISRPGEFIHHGSSIAPLG